jgi:hypothetical protein
MMAIRRPPEIFDHLPMPGEISVGKVKTGDIHSRPDHLLHDFGSLGGRSDGADHLGLFGGKGHGYGSSFKKYSSRL